MEVKEKVVKYFENQRGKSPFREWLSKLKDVKGRAKIDVRIRRAGLGNLGDHRSVGDSVGGDKSTQGKDILHAKENLKEWRKQNEKK